MESTGKKKKKKTYKAQVPYGKLVKNDLWMVKGPFISKLDSLGWKVLGYLVYRRLVWDYYWSISSYMLHYELWST